MPGFDSVPGVTDFLARTRASYDTLAADYTDWITDELAARPLDRALLTAFAELVRAGDGGPVADIGCGPGRMSAFLHDLGVDVFGIDLSPRMVAIARRLYPDLRFAEGSMTELALRDGSLGGIVAWYSVIHVPEEELPRVFVEFHRVLAPGGYLQLAFQAGDEVAHWTEVAGHTISLDFHRRQPDRVTELLRRAGFEVRTRTLREPDDDGRFPESTPQAYLLARKQTEERP
ncbi:Methyltransferase domain-containing protein [Amycolatopsis arida]|uniref:Methyltransferase domain-containing protein n=1 Tax=Amycolatopsis arida TaxID=587909 RepID=A0A1I5T9Q0_9PSEU|nr:class I SAM-dependent methyltransferase [Amycolatopsis arida]TDX96169.1 methyltransferase family protein [Amycolatopsis arida]SFP79752.1 Methyltransferase domain-containing protein [Amycolatopsis arida]